MLVSCEPLGFVCSRLDIFIFSSGSTASAPAPLGSVLSPPRSSSPRTLKPRFRSEMYLRRIPPTCTDLFWFCLCVFNKTPSTHCCRVLPSDFFGRTTKYITADQHFTTKYFMFPLIKRIPTFVVATAAASVLPTCDRGSKVGTCGRCDVRIHGRPPCPEPYRAGTGSKSGRRRDLRQHTLPRSETEMPVMLGGAVRCARPFNRTGVHVFTDTALFGCRAAAYGRPSVQ